MRYIATAVTTWRGRLQLLAATIAFHLNNGLGRRGAGRRKLDLVVLIGGRRHPVRVRPNRGDLFILYEVLGREAYAIPAHRLAPEGVDVIVDCGANIGLAALYFAERYRNARILAVEPDPDNFEVLKRNVAGCRRIEPLWAAVVGGTSRPVHLTRDRAAYGNSIEGAAAPGSTTEVPGLTIADICARTRVQRIDLLKVDIEGAERGVFADAAFLPMVGFVAIELHAPYDLADFSKDVARYGFVAESPGPDTCRQAHIARPGNV
jgi:FkbM family methyltransferase